MNAGSSGGGGEERPKGGGAREAHVEFSGGGNNRSIQPGGGCSSVVVGDVDNYFEAIIYEVGVLHSHGQFATAAQQTTFVRLHSYLIPTDLAASWKSST